VFANLVGNAIRFTPEGGRIVLSARPASGGVRFAVADTGQGIPAADLGEIFVRYRRSGRGKKHGAGLGLAIVRGIVESHGGTIAADSREGEGSVFHFFLPRAGPR
jgi:signal transduction histidine kinase